ncbi:hypothetical protein [Pseudoalteromonas sp. BSi20652]|uniref:hypothetical protein n=1 Tax=Pseudoalteromonas sp. BSi20652 TaxID=388384 RepID=UPI000517D488
MPLIEATACGTKVCCSSIKVFEEIMGESAFFFDPRSVESIKSSIVSILSSDDEKQALHIDRFR